MLLSFDPYYSGGLEAAGGRHSFCVTPCLVCQPVVFWQKGCRPPPSSLTLQHPLINSQQARHGLINKLILYFPFKIYRNERD